ncbi:amylo-alpha-1,6-glucosidase [soil metagenome]
MSRSLLCLTLQRLGQRLGLGLCFLSFLTNSVVLPQAAVAEQEKQKIQESQEQKKPEQKTPEQAELDKPRLVIKNGSIFIVFDPDGTMSGGPSAPYGLYLNDTRYLRELTLAVDGKPLNASSSQTKDGYKATFQYLSNKGILLDREIVIDTASKNNGLVVEQIVASNQSKEEKEIDLQIDFNFDFKDMFEVRGQARKAHGVKVSELKDNEVKSLYTGLDNKVLTSAIQFSAATKLNNNQAHYQIKLAPGAKQTIEFAVLPEAPLQATPNFAEHKLQADKDFEYWKKNNVSITCDNAKLNQVFEQAVRDLYVLKINTPRGPAFAAGLPWYSVAFGRDQVITALQILDFAPDSAKEIITLLANYQGVKEDKFTEETPGKIMHELRTGEMARTREIPFIPYYGTVDATPLWLVLVNRYVATTGDIETASRLWPNIEAALTYLKANTANDFLFYGKVAENGKEPALTNQAWKDSGDSVMYKDGKLAKPPIAICEVQGYLYDAWISGANLADKLGKGEEAKALRLKAKKLKKHFKTSFWLPEQKYIALALDGDSKPCSVVASNAGHLLTSGIIDQEEKLAISKRLLKSDMFSGWGIRTLSSEEKAYDPASYHNGSVWPHDNSLILAGMRKELPKETANVISALFEVAMESKDKRLPELFCGYPRKRDEAAPKSYAVSCVPQLWCVGGVFSMVESLAGSLAENQEDLVQPVKALLPQGLKHMRIVVPSASKKRSIIIEIDKKDGSEFCQTKVTVLKH